MNTTKNSTDEQCNPEPPTFREVISRPKSHPNSLWAYGLVLTVLVPMWLIATLLGYLLKMLGVDVRTATAQGGSASTKTATGELRDAHTARIKSMDNFATEEDITKLEVMMDDLENANEKVQAMYYPFVMLKLISLVGEEEALKLLSAAVEFFEATDPGKLKRGGADDVDQEWPQEIG